MREVWASEAKDKIEELLDLAERGEEIIITRHGKKIARLVPAGHVHNRDEARAALDRIRKRAEQLKLGRFDWSEWKAYRDEGRP
jgi:prevent-host-death family protein